MAIAIDPICKMDVEITPDAIQAEFDGVKYYFCMQGCKDRFLTNPQRYLNSDSEEFSMDKPGLIKRLFRR